MKYTVVGDGQTTIEVVSLDNPLARCVSIKSKETLGSEGEEENTITLFERKEIEDMVNSLSAVLEYWDEHGSID